MAFLPERIDLHVHVHTDDLSGIVESMREQSCLLQQVLAALQVQQQEITGMSQEMDDLVAAVHANSDTEDAAIQAISGLRDMIAASAGDPAKLAALTQEITQRQAALAAAITTTPPGQPPTPVPTPDPNPAPAPDPNQQPGIGTPPADGTAPGAPVIT
jgi:hypothetical protein